MNYNITTDTHNIDAYYELINDGFESGAQPVDVNGNTLKEITNDLITFFNESEETAENFEIYEESNVDGDVTIKLHGAFYKYNEAGEGEYSEETIAVEVVIQATEK